MIENSAERARRESTMNRLWGSSRGVAEVEKNAAYYKRARKIAVLPSTESIEESSAQFAISLIQGKWKTPILCRLQHGPVRLSELRRMFPEASKKMLAQNLRQMEKDGLVVRKDMSSKLLHVEYSLSDRLGVAVLSLIATLTKWSKEYLPHETNGPE